MKHLKSMRDVQDVLNFSTTSPREFEDNIGTTFIYTSLKIIHFCHDFFVSFRVTFSTSTILFVSCSFCALRFDVFFHVMHDWEGCV